MAACLVSAAVVRTVTLDGDYGCGVLTVQAQRIAAMKTIYDAGKLWMQGRETTASRGAYFDAVNRLAALSKTACIPVVGQFPVLEARLVEGVQAVRVEPRGSASVWVLTPFDK